MENLGLNKEEELNQQKASLLDDLVATSTVLEEIWNYHPENPNQKDIVKEYNILKQIQIDIERELGELNS